MIARICLPLLLVPFVAIPSLSQVEPSATGGDTPTLNSPQMLTPPPVSGLQYPTTSGEETRSNYLDMGISMNAAYTDNILPNVFATPVSDETYSIVPSIDLNRTTTKQTAILSYSPTILFYGHTSSLDAVNHNASLIFQDRPSPHTAISLQDFYVRTSNVFSGQYPFSQGGLTGSTVAPVPAVIAPYAEQQTDTASGALTYQFAADGMVGGGGSYTNLDFPNPSQATGLYGSSGESGSAFYSRRLSAAQYIGVSYDYSRTVTNPPNGTVDVQMHTPLPFYTIYFNTKSSLSFSGGAQYISISQGQLASSNTWSPAGAVSMGWQGNRGAVAISYLHVATSGGGLLGAVHSDSVNASGNLAINRTWSASLGASYATISAVTQLVGLSYSGGNSFTANASLQHAFGEHFTVQGGYDRLAQTDIGIAVISATPNSDREFVAIAYVFRKPLGL
ncbi:MAG: hypothetical protein ABSE36_11195 [Terracidiphilus sp.]|jgi:hypothetical protein